MATKKKSKKRRSGFKKIDISKKMEETRDLLIDIVNEEGFISKYTLEGHLLYTLGCTNLQMYNIIMTLTINQELIPLNLSDGVHYKYHPIN